MERQIIWREEGYILLERIERWCKENNTTIFALEKKCGLGNATIRSWATSSPRMDTLMKVSDAMGIPVEELIQCKKIEREGEKSDAVL